ncbi:transposase [Siccirubricoccus phaeus]|uniref:transposase n=1 Tax=Siccirubricoccus phaeus TaxID=2595053 RepID=UPI0011F3BB66|nr:transposase [Siccirubricoccus phaeus]
MRHFTPRRPYTPLTDEEWAVLAPHFPHTDPDATAPGRPLTESRREGFEAMLFACVTDTPWTRLPRHHGAQPLSVARHFRRLAHEGVWSRLPEALIDPRCPRLLKAMEYWACRLARRARARRLPPRPAAPPPPGK